MTPHESDKIEDLDDCEQGKAEERNASADSEATDAPAERPLTPESREQAMTRNAANDRTITMILNSAGRKGIALGSTTGSRGSNSIKTMKKVLVDDEGIIADEDKYDIKGMLAKGGMGMVMAAEDVNIRRFNLGIM